jgi:hypothetical protein
MIEKNLLSLSVLTKFIFLCYTQDNEKYIFRFTVPHPPLLYSNNIRRTSITKLLDSLGLSFFHVRKMCLILLPTIVHFAGVIVHYHHDLALQLQLNFCTQELPMAPDCGDTICCSHLSKALRNVHTNLIVCFYTSRRYDPGV